MTSKISVRIMAVLTAFVIGGVVGKMAQAIEEPSRWEVAGANCQDNWAYDGLPLPLGTSNPIPTEK
jgi:hypothetical protein